MAIEPLSLLALTPSLMQAGQGIKQKRLLKNLKPDNYIPGSTLEKEARARSRANQTTLPGQARAEEKIDAATSNAISATRRNSRDSSSVLERVQESDATAKSQKADINANLEAFKLRNEQILGQALSEKGRYQKQNRDQYNAARSALEGASRQNFFNAATNAATAAIVTDGFQKKPSGGNNLGGTTMANVSAITDANIPTNPISPGQQADLNLDPVTASNMKENLVPIGPNNPYRFLSPYQNMINVLLQRNR